MKNTRNKIAKLRTEHLEAIKSFMESRNVTELNVTFSGDCPIVINGDDDWDTYTLDRITLKTNSKNTQYKIWLDASSSDESTTVAADNIDLELLVDLVEWLEENAEEIDDELAEE